MGETGGALSVGDRSKLGRSAVMGNVKNVWDWGCY
jgi:hypothetical protein